MKFLYAFVMATLLLSGLAHAKGPSGQAGSSFIPIEEAQRVRIFPSMRNKTDLEGQILVCPGTFIATHEGQCALESDPKAPSQWQPMQSLVIAGYEIAGFAFAYEGSTNQFRNLLVYFRKKP